MCDYTIYKKKVLASAKWLSEEGYFGSLRGSGGNVSLRIDDDSMAITPSSLSYQSMTAEDICIVAADGTVVESQNGAAPSVESGLHSAVYRVRPDVQAVVHTHQTYGSLFSVIGTPIPPLFDEVSFSLGTHVDLIPYALSGTPELADNVEQKVSNHANAYLLQNHGILALGKTLDKAILHAELLEKTAHIYYMAISTGKQISTLPDSIIELISALRAHDAKEALAKK